MSCVDITAVVHESVFCKIVSVFDFTELGLLSNDSDVT